MKIRIVLLVVGSLFLLSSPASSTEKSVKLTLSESIKQALEGNLDIRIAEIQLQKVESEIAQKRPPSSRS